MKKSALELDLMMWKGVTHAGAKMTETTPTTWGNVGLRGLDQGSECAAYQKSLNHWTYQKQPTSRSQSHPKWYGRLQKKVSIDRGICTLWRPCICLCLIYSYNLTHMNKFALMINLTYWYLMHRHNKKPFNMYSFT